MSRTCTSRICQRAVAWELGGLLAVALSAGGCAATPTQDALEVFLAAHDHEVSASELRVGPRDTIRISAPRILEIDGDHREVQADGKINLRLVGEVQVAGMTHREIAAKLTELFAPYYRNPQIQVRIDKLPSKVFYVLGQVNAAGPYPYTGRDTLLHTLAVAHPNNIAWTSRVKVIRPNPDEDERRELEIDVDRMVKSGDTRLNVLLEPGDVVYVPPTPLGWVGLRMQELLYPAAPVLRAYAAPLDAMQLQDDYENPETAQRRSF